MMTLVDRMTAPLAQLMEPPKGLEYDYSRPPGAHALVSPDSLSWRIFKNPVTLFVGGVTAVILELAEPSVRTGVWDHSSFRKDALMRLRRTGAAAMMTVYGPREEAKKMIAHVVRMHDRVQGTTPDGTPYHANDPDLLNWVQATASYGFIEAYSRYAEHLTPEEVSQAFAEAGPAAELYGATGAPKSTEQWQTLYRTIEPGLERSGILFEFLDIMRREALLPAPIRPLQRLVTRAAIDLVPPDLRLRLGLDGDGLGTSGRRTVGFLARVANRIPLRPAPPAQSCRRMGLPTGYLYR